MKFGHFRRDLGQYNSLQNPSLLARGRGGSPEHKPKDWKAGVATKVGEKPWEPPQWDHDTFVQKLKDCSVELQPFSKETPHIEERLVYPNEDEIFPNLPDVK